jgi:hypothetical protein
MNIYAYFCCMSTTTHIDRNQEKDHTNWIRCPICRGVLVDMVVAGTAIFRVKCRKCKTYILVKNQ